jgi:hypothetical protein
VLPHYSFAEYGRAFQSAPDLIVIPYIPDAAAEGAELVRWIRRPFALALHAVGLAFGVDRGMSWRRKRRA